MRQPLHVAIPSPLQPKKQKIVRITRLFRRPLDPGPRVGRENILYVQMTFRFF